MIEARKKLTQLPEELGEGAESGMAVITRRGKPVLAVLSWDRYESLMETLEILGDEEMMASFRQDQKDREDGAAPGNYKSIQEVKQELGLEKDSSTSEELLPV